MSNETKVSGPVDVRAVLGQHASGLRDVAASKTKLSPKALGNIANDLARVNVAVAELIEANKAYDEARKAHGDTYHSGGMTERSTTHRALEDAKRRRAAALANVGGAK